MHLAGPYLAVFVGLSRIHGGVRRRQRVFVDALLLDIELDELAATAAAPPARVRKELARQRTRVTSLHVGYMDTDMARRVTEPKADPDAGPRRPQSGTWW